VIDDNNPYGNQVWITVDIDMPLFKHHLFGSISNSPPGDGGNGRAMRQSRGGYADLPPHEYAVEAALRRQQERLVTISTAVVGSRVRRSSHWRLWPGGTRGHTAAAAAAAARGKSGADQGGGRKKLASIQTQPSVPACGVGRVVKVVEATRFAVVRWDDTHTQGCPIGNNDRFVLAFVDNNNIST
jgi:hypothetical protein